MPPDLLERSVSKEHTELHVTELSFSEYEFRKGLGMRVVVVGGGVAGSTAAIALRRIGAEVTVLEAYVDPAGQVGSFLSLAYNGLSALDELGCLGAVQA